MSFTSKSIFKDPRLNAQIDFLYETMAKEFTTDDPDEDSQKVQKHFVLSGRAAAILQGELSQNIDNIVFETNQQDYFRWLKEFCDTNKFKWIGFKNKILFYPNGFYFEVWMTDTISLVTHENIYLQSLNLIPEDTL